jgi:uncharacterized protein (DUF342 family)
MAVAATASRQLKSRSGFCITVSTDELNAFLTLTSSEENAQGVSEAELVEELKQAGVVFGLLDEELRNLAENQVFDKKILVARGKPPHMGKDAQIEYTFGTNQKKTPTEGRDGRIDYKNLEYIQNASAGEILAKKTPLTEGSQGKSVFGTDIPSQPGRDKSIGKGANTSLSEDGLELRADIDGSIVFTNGITNVLAVQTISGSVDASTGNIECNGSLKITKNVKSGFRVKVKGDLEISGHVEDAEIECEGNIIVKGGFFGNSVGSVKAKGDVTIKWVNGQQVHSDGMLTIGGEAINCRLYGKEGIVILGSKGKISGGEAASRNMIRAPELGSEGGATTHLKVAFDAEILRQLKQVEAELERINEDHKRVKEGLTALYRLQMDGKLSPEKEAVLRKLEVFLKSAPEKKAELEVNRDALLGKLKEIADAEIIAERKAYPGTVVHFGVVYKEVVDARGATRFHVDCDTIIASEYSPPS